MTKYIPDLFKKADKDAKPMLRWWMPDAGADLGQVAEHVKMLYAKGFGGVEVAMVPQFVDFDPKEYGWGTPRWKEIMRTILKTARELPEHFKVDFTITAHWPPSLNTITPNDPRASQEMVMLYQKVGSQQLELPLPEIRTSDNDFEDASDYIFKNDLVSVSIGMVQALEPEKNRVVLDWDSMQCVDHLVSHVKDPATGEDKFTPAGIPLHENSYGSKAKLADKQYYWQIDLSGLDICCSEGQDIQVGDWLLFASYSRGTGQVLSGREMKVLPLSVPMADKMYVIDYFGTGGADAIIDYWNDNYLSDPELAQLLRENGGALFEDSIEASYGGQNWSPGLLEDFEKRRGYDVRPYLALVNTCTSMGFGTRFISDPGLSVRVTSDFARTVTDRYVEYHIGRLTDWAHSIGCQYRAQAYGSGLDTSAAVLHLDIAEGESLGFGGNYDYFRNIAGGVHFSGRKLVSDEVLADLGKAYDLTWANAAYTLNQNFAAGVNRMIIHGTSFGREHSGKFSQWPGWHAFQVSFAEPWDRRQAYWEDADIISGYISRMQAVLQNGQPDMDICLYKNHKDYGTGFEEMLDSGLNFDVIGDAALRSDYAFVKDGHLSTGGYRGVLINDSKTMSLAAAKKLTELAEAGIPVVFYEAAPQQVTGLCGELMPGLDTDAALKTQLEALFDTGKAAVATTPKDIARVFRNFGLVPNADYSVKGLRSLCRVEKGNRYYMFFNSSAQETIENAAISLLGTGKAYAMNGWTGAITSLEAAEKDGRTEICLTLLPGEAVIVALDGDGLLTETAKALVPGEKALDIDGWSLKLESWGPDETSEDPTVSKKTMLDFGPVALGSWNDLDAAKAELAGVETMGDVSGIGWYETAFTLDAPLTKAVLEIKHGKDMVTGVWLNGTKLPVADPCTDLVPVDGLLKQGKNTLRIKLTSTMKHRVSVENPWNTKGMGIGGDMPPMGEDGADRGPDMPMALMMDAGLQDPNDPEKWSGGNPPPASTSFHAPHSYGLQKVTLLEAK